MNTKIISTLLASAMLLSLLTACDDSASSASTSVPKSEPTTSASETQASADEGDLGDCHAKILDCETGIQDYDGNPIIGVKYEFTNNSDVTTSFDVALLARAYQDGIELDCAYIENSSAEYNNLSKSIKPGATITCEEYYVMTSDTSDVEVEVEESFSFSTAKLEKTFEIGK